MSNVRHLELFIFKISVTNVRCRFLINCSIVLYQLDYKLGHIRDVALIIFHYKI